MAGPGVSTSHVTHPLTHIPADGELFRLHQPVAGLLHQQVDLGANAVLSTLPQPLQTAGVGFFLRYPGVPAQLLDAVRDGGAAQRFSAFGVEDGA